MLRSNLPDMLQPCMGVRCARFSLRYSISIKPIIMLIRDRGIDSDHRYEMLFGLVYLA